MARKGYITFADVLDRRDEDADLLPTHLHILPMEDDEEDGGTVLEIYIDELGQTLLFDQDELTMFVESLKEIQNGR